MNALTANSQCCQNAIVDFEKLANEHKDAVYRQMLRVCGNREDAEDVLIEALLKAYQHLHQLNDAVAFRAWLAQIARRVCWQLKEREALSPLLQLSMLEEEGAEIKDPKPPLDSGTRAAAHEGITAGRGERKSTVCAGGVSPARH